MWWQDHRFSDPVAGHCLCRWNRESAFGNGRPINHSDEPDVAMGCCGDVPTLETLAAVDWLRHNLPAVKIRVVNGVDLMTLQTSMEHRMAYTIASSIPFSPPPRRPLLSTLGDLLIEHKLYIRKYWEDMPEIRDWQWPA